MVFALASAYAQNIYDPILQQIEANNTTLNALRLHTDADKLGQRTGLLPDNPELEFNYLWGSPSTIGNRTDIRATQSFDFPTAYAHRARIANLQNQNAEWLYKAERRNILLHAQQTCIELVYYNALSNEYAVRLQNALLVASAYKTKWERGETNVLEHNKAQLNLATVQAEVAQMEVERTALLSELTRLNGGKEVSFSATQYPPCTLPPHFADWYDTAEEKSPMLQYVRTQIDIEQQQIKLQRSIGLPKFTVGYMSEKVVREHFQGITAGISIPLWENKNRVKQAKAQAYAAQAQFDDNKTQFYNHLQTSYLKAVSLQQNAHNIRQSLATHNNEPLLKKALDAGEISLLDYLLEVEFYYNAINKALEAERDFELAAAELKSFEW